MKTTANFPKVFESRIVAEKARELGIGEKMMHLTEDEKAAYFNAFGLEVIEGTYQGVPAKLEVASYNGSVLAGWAFAGGQDMFVPAESVDGLKNQIHAK